MKEEVVFFTTMDSPLGPLTLFVDQEARAVALHFEGEKSLPEGVKHARSKEMCQGLVLQLKEYFSGSRKHFDIPLRLEGTPFQKAVWQELLNISAGETASYSDVAKRIGKHSASRAVGQAVGANPLTILVPCHRVISASGKIGGYGGGLDRKRWLLRLEGSWKR